MRITRIKFLSEYKQFKEGQEFQFSAFEQENTIASSNKFSVLVGRNGSGKTTLMSLIPTLFHHIERYNGKIPANFEIQYKIKNKHITIRHFNNLIRVTVPNLYDNIQVVPKRNPNSNDFSMINKNEKFIEYFHFHEFTPRSVVSSAFSLHGEYPTSRPRNYKGHRIVSDQSITNIYGKNHWQMGSISRGILRFVRLFFDSKSEIQELLKLFDLKFTNRVEHKHFGDDSRWMEVNKQWLKRHDIEVQMEEAYLNDLEFERYGRKITLSNMSSGEKMLLLRAISILNSIENDSIVIVEEPELHLDQVWNRQLMTLFKILFRNYKSHIIIATHDYSIINSVSKNNLIFLDYGRRTQIKDNTFLASYDELFSILYGDKFKPNEVEANFLKNLSLKSKEELEADYEELGNSFYKYMVFKQLKSMS